MSSNRSKHSDWTAINLLFRLSYFSLCLCNFYILLCCSLSPSHLNPYLLATFNFHVSLSCSRATFAIHPKQLDICPLLEPWWKLGWHHSNSFRFHTKSCTHQNFILYLKFQNPTSLTVETALAGTESNNKAIKKIGMSYSQLINWFMIDMKPGTTITIWETK